jgi:hypothetical protein
MPASEKPPGFEQLLGFRRLTWTKKKHLQAEKYKIATKWAVPDENLFSFCKVTVETDVRRTAKTTKATLSKPS